jgi:hypothetical protein
MMECCSGILMVDSLELQLVDQMVQSSVHIKVVLKDYLWVVSTVVLMVEKLVLNLVEKLGFVLE